MPSQLLLRTQHPRDGFTMIRFTVKLPRSTRSGHEDADADANADDDYEDDADADADEDEPDTTTSGSSHIQLFELCFHEPFVPDDSQPISLHFDSLGPESILQYPSTLAIPRPSPPAYIHEVPEVMDLTVAALSLPPPSTTTTTTTTTASPISAASKPPPRGLLCPVLVAIVFGLLAVLTSSAVLLDLVPWPRPIVVSLEATDGTLYTFNRTAATAPLELTSRLLPIVRLRASSAESLLYYMSRVDHQEPRILAELENAMTDTCRGASARLSLRQGALSLDANHDVALICYALHERINHARTLWSDVHRHTQDRFFDRPLRGLQFASLHIKWGHGAEPAQQLAAIVGAYRDVLFDRDVPELGTQCLPCSPRANNDSFPPDPDEALSGDPRDWHFACDSSFRSTLVSNIANPSAAAAYLRQWALRRSRRRLALLRKPIFDLDGEPMFPNNQHPYYEADDVMDTRLLTEDDFTALTRHVLELSQALRDLVAVLGTHGLPVAANHSSAHLPAADAATQTRRWFHWAASPASTPADAPTPPDPDTSLYNSTARLLRIDDEFLGPLTRELAQASAYGLLACRLIDSFFHFTNSLSEGRGWTALQPAQPGGNDPSHYATELVHNRFVLDLEAESDLIKHEAEALSSALRRVREHKRSPLPVAKTSPSTRDSGTKIDDEQGKTMMRKIGQRFQNPALDRLVEMVGGQHANTSSGQDTFTSTDNDRVG